MRFDDCLKIILRFEGGYSCDPSDRGGATNKGITTSTYDAWRKACGLSTRTVALITDDEINAIYKQQYWFAAKCQLLPEPIDLYTFDAAVQHGPERAIKQLQRALGVETDGIAGNETLDALQEEIHAGRLKELADHLISIRLDFYDAIVDNDPRQEKFIVGWKNRVSKLEHYA